MGKESWEVGDDGKSRLPRKLDRGLAGNLQEQRGPLREPGTRGHTPDDCKLRLTCELLIEFLVAVKGTAMKVYGERD
jgi:hypothetical protein